MKLNHKQSFPRCPSCSADMVIVGKGIRELDLDSLTRGKYKVFRCIQPKIACSGSAENDFYILHRDGRLDKKGESLSFYN